MLSVLITARILGPRGRGEVAFLTTIGFLGSQLSSLGIEQAVSNFSGQDETLSPRLATNAAILALVTGSIAAAFIAMLVAVVPAAGGGAPAGLRWLVLVSLPILNLQLYLQRLAMAQYRFGVSNATWILVPVVNVLVNGTLAVLGVLSVATAVASWVAGQWLATGLILWNTHHRLQGFGPPDLKLARRMLSFGIRAHAGRALLLGNYRVDQWILGAVAGAHELGIYSVAVAWSEALFFLPTALMLVQRPDLVRASPPDAYRHTVQAFRPTLVITFALGTALVVLAPFLCGTVFGPGFAPAAEQTRVLVLGAFGIAALKLFGNALTGQGKPLRETASITIGFVCVLGLDIALIPSHGGLGAAAASAVGYTAGGLAAVLIFCSALNGRLVDFIPRAGDIALLWDVAMNALHRRKGSLPDDPRAATSGPAGDPQ
jgi:O-antigen/teichoic acid export membrane protein